MLLKMMLIDVQSINATVKDPSGTMKTGDGLFARDRIQTWSHLLFQILHSSVLREFQSFRSTCKLVSGWGRLGLRAESALDPAGRTLKAMNIHRSQRCIAIKIHRHQWIAIPVVAVV